MTESTTVSITFYHNIKINKRELEKADSQCAVIFFIIIDTHIQNNNIRSFKE